MFAPKIAKPQTKTAADLSSLVRPRWTLAAQRHSPAEQALFLQRTIGNQATLRLLSPLARSLTENEPHGHNEQKADLASAAPPGVPWDFSKIPLFPSDRAHSAPQLRDSLQPKLAVGQVNDPLEHEADRVADQVMRMPNPSLSVVGVPGQISRKCATCEEEETEQTLQTKRAGVSEATVGRAPAVVHQVLNSPAQPLDAATRTFMEIRFGRDFQRVRVHTGQAATFSARALNALAYTVGADIVFDAGQYAPESDAGRRLIAHELAHVVQQAQEPAPVVRRITYGAANPPHHAWAVVPANEHAHVDETIAMVDDVVNNPKKYGECHDHYASQCPGGTAQTLAKVWGRAVLWKIVGKDPNVLARGDTGGPNLAYTQEGYDQNAAALAQTLMHEAGHNCGIPGDATHWRADQIASYCMGPGKNAFSVQAGGRPGGEVPLMLLSYRRFLGDWASGRLRATLGADFDPLATGLELTPPVIGQRPAGEFGSVMGGLHGRLGGWGGSRYGGFSVRVETGIGIGRFSLRPATPADAPGSTILPAWVLQVGPRAEFLFKVGDAALPVSIGVAYRLTQPLNAEAQALHGILGSVELRF